MTMNLKNTGKKFQKHQSLLDMLNCKLEITDQHKNPLLFTQNIHFRCYNKHCTWLIKWLTIVSLLHFDPLTLNQNLFNKIIHIKFHEPLETSRSYCDCKFTKLNEENYMIIHSFIHGNLIILNT